MVNLKHKPFKSILGQVQVLFCALANLRSDFTLYSLHPNCTQNKFFVSIFWPRVVLTLKKSKADLIWSRVFVRRSASVGRPKVQLAEFPCGLSSADRKVELSKFNIAEELV